MPSTRNIRFRIFLVFALFALGTVAIVAFGVYQAGTALAALDGEEMWRVLLSYGSGAAFFILVLTIGLWHLFDARLVAPAITLIRDIETVVHANPYHTVAIEHGSFLGDLPEATRDIAERLAAAREETKKTVDSAVAGMEEQKSRLEAILRDLHDGVILCNLGHQVLLYNQQALAILRTTGRLGLGRSLFTMMTKEPILHAFERLTYRHVEEREVDGRPVRAAPFVCSTVDGRFTLEARMSLILDQKNEATGYVITFGDVTDELTALGTRDRLLRQAIEGLRRPVANLRAAAETLAGHSGMTPDERQPFEDVIFAECRNLSATLDSMAAEYRDIITGHWPTSDFYSANLINCVVRRYQDHSQIHTLMTGIPIWMHGDSHSLVELLVHIIERVNANAGAVSFDLDATTGERHSYLDVVWTGEPIPSGVLDAWLDEPLEKWLGGLSGRDVLDHHRAELWSQPLSGNRARLRLPLPRAMHPHRQEGSPNLPARPEFYDFGLLQQAEPTGERGSQPLRSLVYVVLDTETTGLKPSEGDEMVSIAGVRIVNGRILTGESFSQLIDPKRSILRTSIRFHGITGEMVKDKPPVHVVLPRFHDFVGDAVLVAHNAAFDMKFIRLKEAEAGVRFLNPVLDTLLLSAFLHDHVDDHSLDAVAKRLGVEISGRHTALGDSLVTAGIFLRMLDLLEVRGVTTLGETLVLSRRIAETRVQQAEF